MVRQRRMYARPLFVVVGILGPLLARFILPFGGCFGAPPWHRQVRRIYAGGMNDAILGATENPLQSAVAPQLSVIVPTFNERDNVTTLLRRREQEIAATPFDGVF